AALEEVRSAAGPPASASPARDTDGRDRPIAHLLAERPLEDLPGGTERQRLGGGRFAGGYHDRDDLLAEIRIGSTGDRHLAHARMARQRGLDLGRVHV